MVAAVAKTPSSPDVELLYNDYHHWLVCWIHARVGSHSNAADLAQDTFVRILSRQQSLAELREPRAWLASIARGLIIDRARRERLELAWLEVQQQLPEPEMPSPEQTVLLLDMLEQVDVLLGGLSAKARSAFLLSRLEGLSYREIAERLAVSPSSVEKYMAQAIRHCVLAQASFAAETL